MNRSIPGLPVHHQLPEFTQTHVHLVSDAALANFKGYTRDKMAQHSCIYVYRESFPGSSAGKESTCNARDPGSIPRLGRSTGEGIGYPLQYSWSFLVAQLVKNPPAIWKTWAQSLVGKIPQRRDWLPTPVFWPGVFNELYIVHELAKSRT